MPNPGERLQDFFAAIIDLRPKFSSGSEQRSIEEVCTDLLSKNDETSIQRIGATILGAYEALDEAGKLQFFQFMRDHLDIDAGRVETLARDYAADRAPQTLKHLMDAAEPPRQDLLRRLNQITGATAALVAMRADLLAHLKSDATLAIVDLDFAHLLSSWFNRGFLQIKPMSWSTAADTLAKLIQYEAVHAIEDWEDLRRRLQPHDRRCFAFFHPVMPNEPLVFVEVALCKGIPTSIQEVLKERDSELIADDADTAVFYSISNCQKGLAGISFGNSLIKQVARDLSRELPNLKTFVTLSPLPGLSRWAAENSERFAPGFLDNVALACRPPGEADGEVSRGLGTQTDLASHSDALKEIAADYLLNAKRADGRPYDPVARFHLSNGASVYAVHAEADLSTNGLERAFGVMVNYHYDLRQVAARHETFTRTGKIEASRSVTTLANAAASQARKNNLKNDVKSETS